MVRHVDPFSLIDIEFPSSARKPFPYSIILILLSVFCGFSVFMLHSYRPLDRSLDMSYLAVTANDSWSPDFHVHHLDTRTI